MRRNCLRRRTSSEWLQEMSIDSQSKTSSMRSKREFDLAIAGELNMDLILYGLPLQLETERDVVGDRFVSTLGSSSAIVAHNAAALGLRVRFATLIGDDNFGRTALGRLEQAGVDVTDAIIDPTQQTGVTILLPHGPVRHCLSFLGSIAKLQAKQLNWRHLAEAQHFHLSSLYLQHGLHDGIIELLQYIKSAGVTVSLDTNDDPENVWGSPLTEVLPYVDVLMPSEGELCRMAGNLGLEAAIGVFAERVDTIVVKRGRRGCRVCHHGEVRDYAGIAVDPVDTIGAGDSFDAGFVYAYVKGYSLEICAHAGNIAGALSTQSTGGTEAFRDGMMRQSFLREHNFPGLGDEN
jgi:sugar/nucleoside kinase (ribokinase family)